MDIHAAIRTRVIEGERVKPLVGSRAYWVERPQGAALPDVTMTAVSYPRDRHMKGFQRLQFIRVQFDCRAKTHKEAVALANAVIADVAPLATVGGFYFDHATANGPRDLGENTAAGFVHRQQVDLIIPHKPKA